MPLNDCGILLRLQSGNQAGVALGSLRDSVSALFSYRESSSMSWDIAQVSVSDEGFYECVATSAAGTGRAQTFLDVSGGSQLPFWGELLGLEHLRQCLGPIKYIPSFKCIFNYGGFLSPMSTSELRFIQQTCFKYQHWFGFSSCYQLDLQKRSDL